MKVSNVVVEAPCRLEAGQAWTCLVDSWACVSERHKLAPPTARLQLTKTALMVPKNGNATANSTTAKPTGNRESNRIHICSGSSLGLRLAGKNSKYDCKASAHWLVMRPDQLFKHVVHCSQRHVIQLHDHRLHSGCQLMSPC